jgi:hypothetical protein
MTPSLAALALGLPLVVAVADRVPNFDPARSCRAAASLTPASLDSCLGDERKARDQLGGQWTQFAPADRTNCTQVTETGGYPSYVELLTCLEMARDAKNLPRDKTDGPTR